MIDVGDPYIPFEIGKHALAYVIDHTFPRRSMVYDVGYACSRLPSLYFDPERVRQPLSRHEEVNLVNNN